MLTASATAPSGWAGLRPAPFQSEGFATGMRAMGYRPLYLHDGTRCALALVRGALPGLGNLAARANVFLDGADAGFTAAVLTALAARGIPYVKVGDTMSGVTWDELPAGWPFSRTRVIPRHTFMLDLTQSESALLKGMDGAERKIRKADREGVEVRLAESPEDLAAYCRLSRDTSERVRTRSAYTDFPDRFFQDLHRSLGPAGTMRFYVAWFRGEPLAGCLFTYSDTTMLYYLGGSTRDRELTAKQAPAAVFWHAIREAKRLGFSRFDLGGCTPTDDADDSRHGVYTFKKRWGGRLETFYNLDVVLSSIPFYLQERVLAPLWDRAHPLYFRLMDAVRGTR
ncbi:MAG TPA: GNAT family N-acetyltransferase [Methylomirabilota bacterium]